MEKTALGLIEVSGLSGAIAATKAASNSTRVDIASAEKNVSGRITVKIEGEWKAVTIAVEAGARAADAVGELISMHIITKTDSSVESILPYQSFVERYQPNGFTGVKKEKALKSTKGLRQKPKSSPSQIQDIKPIDVKVKTEPEANAEAGGSLNISELERMPVVQLRRYARSVAGLPIFGRQISLANKQQLLEAIRAVADKS